MKKICPNCNGTGQQPNVISRDEDDYICRVCKGAKEIEVRDDSVESLLKELFTHYMYYDQKFSINMSTNPDGSFTVYITLTDVFGEKVKYKVNGNNLERVK